MMGGRGATSLSGGGRDRETGSDLKNLGGAPDKREDIQKSFVDELGFSEVLGTNRIPTATLNSYAIALKALEAEYGAIAASDGAKFVTGNGTKTLAAVYWSPDNPKDQFMAINSNILGSTSKNLEVQRRNQSTGWFVSTSDKITKQNAAIVTHEYGHMLHNALASKFGKSVDSFTISARASIIEIARTKYGATGSVPSQYGGSNAKEFFAEAFSSLNSGSPNAYGKAMRDYLKAHKLK